MTVQLQNHSTVTRQIAVNSPPRKIPADNWKYIARTLFLLLPHVWSRPLPRPFLSHDTSCWEHAHERFCQIICLFFQQNSQCSYTPIFSKLCQHNLPRLSGSYASFVTIDNVVQGRRQSSSILKYRSRTSRSEAIAHAIGSGTATSNVIWGCRLIYLSHHPLASYSQLFQFPYFQLSVPQELWFASYVWT